MPTYTYRCGNCDHRFDLIQRFNDPDPHTCPKCSFENELSRVYKPVGVVFKGSGFYATDNKSSSALSTNGAKPSSNGAAAESTPGQTEKNKPEKSSSDKSADTN